MNQKKINLPEIVSQEEWVSAQKKLLAREKEMTKKLYKLATERRRLPMVRVDCDYTFTGLKGEVSLIDLFHGRRQLIVYCAMLEPGPKPCSGYSMVMDNIGHNLAHVNARDTTFVFLHRKKSSPSKNG
ncbi:MAG: DUF899 family protein [Balneolales bacterium]